MILRLQNDIRNASAGNGGIMTVIRKKRSKLLFSAAVGAVGMGICCGGIFLLYTQKTGIRPSEFLKMEEKMEPSVVVRLLKDVSEGEILSSQDLEEVMIQAPEGKIKHQERSFYEGKRLKISMEEDGILSESMVYDGQKTADDVRLLNLSYVKLSEKMKDGDYVDVRISFRNGGDYVLLSRKKIQDISGNGADGEEGEEERNALWLQVNEEEILRLASAVVDAFYQEGCEIYAIQYVSETQEAAVVTYPVNETVRKLLDADPNVAALAQGSMTDGVRKELRSALEKEEEEVYVN